MESAASGPVVKVTLRLPPAHARLIAIRARRADVSQGEYVAGLVEGTPPTPLMPRHGEVVAELSRSTSIMAALGVDLNHVAGADAKRRDHEFRAAPCQVRAAQRCRARACRAGIPAHRRRQVHWTRPPARSQQAERLREADMTTTIDGVLVQWGRPPVLSALAHKQGDTAAPSRRIDRSSRRGDPGPHRRHRHAPRPAGDGQGDGRRAWHGRDRGALPLHQQERSTRDR